MPEPLHIRKIWRLIIRGLASLEPDTRKFHLQQLRKKLLPFLPAYNGRIQPKPLSAILEEENLELDSVDFGIDFQKADSRETLGAWDALYQFVIAIDGKSPGLSARALWDTIADFGELPEIPLTFENSITISEGLSQELIKTLPSRYSQQTFNPPPLANPPDILGRDSTLIESSPDYEAPVPENACAFHRVLKLKDVCLVGSEVPAILGGGIPISLSQRIIPDDKRTGDGYGGGDIPSGLLRWLFAKNGTPGNELERVEQAFLLPGAGIPDNFFHGAVDSLPALQHYFDEGLNCPIVIPELGRGARELLDLLVEQYGIPQDRIWSREKASGYLFWEAIMPPRHDFGQNLPQFYRPLCDQIVSSTEQQHHPSKIYLTRGGKGIRAIANEKHVETTMKRFGFAVIEIWKLPMKEQIALMANADVIAGPFGAGLTGLLFAREGTRVIEILNHKNFDELGMPYKRISDSCSLEHFTIVADTLFNSVSMTPREITISLTRLDKILKRLVPPTGLGSRIRIWKHDLARLRRKLFHPSDCDRLPESQFELFVSKHFKSNPKPLFHSPITSTGVFLCFVNRSGSNYLAECLAASGKFPLAKEFFLSSNMRRNSSKGSDLSNFVEEIVSKNTLNEHFAAKLGYAQLAFFDSLGFLDTTFESTKFIYLKRQDILAQAISLDIATQDKQWKSGSSSLETKDLQYSRKRLEQKMNGIRLLYENFEEFFSQRNLKPLTIIYEDLINHPSETAERMSVFLDHSIAIDLKKIELKPQPHPVKEIWKRRFLDGK